MQILRAVACVVVLSACAQSGAERARAAELSTAYVDDVSVRAEPGVWPGRSAVKDQVVPVRVTIRNNSGKPVRLRYSDFSLVDTKGTRYSALPPFEIKTTGDRPLVAGGYTPMTKPGFAHSGFVVLPAYSPLYPGIGTYENGFSLDPVYYQSYFAYWRQSGLPSDEMLSRAIPEGVLAHGGSITGFMYFEHVPKDAQNVRFVAELVDAQTSNTFGTVVLPMPPRG